MFLRRLRAWRRFRRRRVRPCSGSQAIGVGSMAPTSGPAGTGKPTVAMRTGSPRTGCRLAESGGTRKAIGTATEQTWREADRPEALPPHATPVYPLQRTDARLGGGSSPGNLSVGVKDSRASRPGAGSRCRNEPAQHGQCPHRALHLGQAGQRWHRLPLATGTGERDVLVEHGARAAVRVGRRRVATCRGSAGCTSDGSQGGSRPCDGAGTRRRRLCRQAIQPARAAGAAAGGAAALSGAGHAARARRLPSCVSLRGLGTEPAQPGDSPRLRARRWNCPTASSACSSRCAGLRIGRSAATRRCRCRGCTGTRSMTGRCPGAASAPQDRGRPVPAGADRH